MIALAEFETQYEDAEQATRAARIAIIEAREAIELANKTRDEFLARMSHELRTPLNAVIGFSRILEANRAGNQRPQDIEMLRSVRTNGERLLGLVQDVLEHSQTGQLELALKDTDVAAIVNRVADDFRDAAASKGLGFRAVVPQDITSVAIDAARLAHVLERLVDNAIKFTPVGHVLITVTADANGAPARIIVADTGIGIPPEGLDSIFEPFHQVDGGRRRAFDGAGLGLPLARRLCAAMNCRLTVESEIGRGSRFAITLPAKP